ncbi:hypothetical protein FRC12_009264 [Ceratobasidium sp. 428]|nr:hypothetical protein FRC12_009264 [Ceratobasidium sp. 428]
MATSIALKWAVEHSPRLAKISLFPSKQPKNVAHTKPEVHKLLAPLYEHPFHQYLLPTLSIRELACSLPVLESAPLKALSMLPYLERLTMYKTSDRIISESQETLLPEHSFPSLKYLRLNLPTSANVNWALRALAILANLKNLTVDIKHLDAYDETLTKHKFFSALTHATQLEALSIVFDADSMKDMLEIGNMKVFHDVLGKLPLKSAFFMPLILPFPDITSMNFNPAWSNVTRLLVPAARVFFHTLPIFSQLPRLEYLMVCLGITTRLLKEIPKPDQELSLRTLEGSPESSVWHDEADLDQVVS